MWPSHVDTKINHHTYPVVWLNLVIIDLKSIICQTQGYTDGLYLDPALKASSSQGQALSYYNWMWLLLQCI